MFIIEAGVTGIKCDGVFPNEFAACIVVADLELGFEVVGCAGGGMDRSTGDGESPTISIPEYGLGFFPTEEEEEDEAPKEGVPLLPEEIEARLWLDDFNRGVEFVDLDSRVDGRLVMDRGVIPNIPPLGSVGPIAGLCFFLELLSPLGDAGRLFTDDL
jgi:hypothetical protein